MRLLTCDDVGRGGGGTLATDAGRHERDEQGAADLGRHVAKAVGGAAAVLREAFQN